MAKQTLKVLYLPYNIASMQGITAEAVNSQTGVHAICLTIGKNYTISSTSNTIELQSVSRKNVFKYLKWVLLKYYYFFKLVIWADVVHYIWDSFLIADLDLRIIKLLKKPGVVEWVGSDIRCPSKSFPINRFIKEVYNKGYEYKKFEKDERSIKIQKKFHSALLEPVAVPEMHLYIEKQLFPIRHVVLQRINVSSFQPYYPDPLNKRPLIIHSPTAKVAKGSNIILPLIDELKNEFDFEFVLIQKMQHDEVLKLMKKADIFLDQIIFGSNGMAALEAMSYGKPVMCYIMPEVFNEGLPNECPIVNTNPENLREQLIKLISDPQLRHDIGVNSRSYVEKYHDSYKIAPHLIDIYRSAMSRRKQKP